MLLRNWYVFRMFKECHLNVNYSSFSMNIEGKQFRRYNGEYLKDVPFEGNTNSNNFYYINNFRTYILPCKETTSDDLNSSCSGCLYPVLGKGDREVTFDDYQMEQLILRSEGYYKVISGSTISSKEKDDGSGRVFTIMFNCQALKDITIREIGMQGGVVCSGYSYPILLIREVLETPIEAKANQTFTVSFDIDMPYPSILETPIGENPTV